MRGNPDVPTPRRTTTSGDARAKLLAAKNAGRTRSHSRLMKRRGDDVTESDIALDGYDDGWKDGYAAGFQQALRSVQGALATSIAAQRTSILSTME